MRAVQVSELTGPAALQIVEVDEPVADGENLLVDVKAAGVSFPELLQTRGQYQVKLDPPFILGGELAGVVREAPAGSGFATGDRVSADERIGLVGTTGRSTGPHLHFEVRRNHAQINPTTVLGQAFQIEVDPAAA